MTDDEHRFELDGGSVVEFPYPIEQVIEGEDLVLAHLAVPGFDDRRVHVAEIDGLDASRPPASEAASFGYLNAWRPIVAFDRDGRLRWHVEAVEHPYKQYLLELSSHATVKGSPGSTLSLHSWASFIHRLYWETGETEFHMGKK